MGTCQNASFSSAMAAVKDSSNRFFLFGDIYFKILLIPYFSDSQVRSTVGQARVGGEGLRKCQNHGSGAEQVAERALLQQTGSN